MKTKILATLITSFLMSLSALANQTPFEEAIQQLKVDNGLMMVCIRSNSRANDYINVFVRFPFKRGKNVGYYPVRVYSNLIPNTKGLRQYSASFLTGDSRHLDLYYSDDQSFRLATGDQSRVPNRLSGNLNLHRSWGIIELQLDRQTKKEAEMTCLSKYVTID